MHFFLAACQGAGLAVAAGALAGAPGRRGGFANVLLVIALVGGALLFGASLIAALIALAALATAGLSVILQPLGLVALIGIVYLGLARRNRAGRKYEGLRSLR